MRRRMSIIEAYLAMTQYLFSRTLGLSRKSTLSDCSIERYGSRYCTRFGATELGTCQTAEEVSRRRIRSLLTSSIDSVRGEGCLKLQAPPPPTVALWGFGSRVPAVLGN